jgi:cytochrome P450
VTIGRASYPLVAIVDCVLSREERFMELEEPGRVFTDPKAYADEKRFHAACAQLRRESPVTRVEVNGFDPFWAVTKHADVMEIARQPDRWINAPRPALGPKPLNGTGDVPVRTLIQMDPPDHAVYRRISSDWFKPKGIARLNDRAGALAKRYVDRMAELGGACDFVTDVAVHYPLYVILSLLGLPEEDFPRMLKLTQQLFGTVDPELGRGTGQAGNDDLLATLLEFFEYFQTLTENRRANPTDDLGSVIANAEIDGQPIGILEAVGYYVLIATAGHDTTSSAIAGGLHALIEHPDQLQRLRTDPTLVATAVEEMIRWVSPVKQFMRTATADYVLRGITIPAGDAVLLSYPSANRDEEVFDRPDVLDVGRDPNPHVGFGFGAHFCLGTHLARMEARALYNELLPRLRWVELAASPAYMETLFVGGPKHLPIRYQLT